MTTVSPHQVVITGAAVVNTLADDLASFTEALRQGRTAITVRDGDPPVAGAWLTDFSVAQWAARAAPDAAGALRAATRRCAPPATTAACVALAACRDAGLSPERISAAALVVAGNNLALAYHSGAWSQFRDDPGQTRATHVLRYPDSDTIGVVSEVLGLRGEGLTVGAASASAAVAVIAAARLIAAGTVRTCVVVAPLAELSELEFAAFMQAGAMASPQAGVPPAELCRPFDSARQGFVYGQGAAAIVIEAPRPGCRAYARLIGHGQRLDGAGGAGPSAEGQAAAMRAALAMGETDAAEVDYVNAHATGSLLGDRVEADALAEVFGGPGPLVNTTKPLTGHCLSGSGMQELVATLLQMRHGFVHPNRGLTHPLSTSVRFAGRVAQDHTITVAMTNSVAFGGINACLLLRQPGGQDE
ncbi:malonyl-ACP decarboxylase [Allocatelliglobosispora scoriae]|uniref:Malonyl-ACP decarboxylase n=1 Tax=Allocatelliglobosispora scoriae TaxID=643052 RepID=A0A841BLR3_9ACTN|nr:beta-ketoacyl synthase N-terminal-like domain-containing protein [Allocatelliglobosispora scoriae]MBB5867760.1 malonyl-ACP decarboxylase [Allocatelliglobosispora scoriae]